MFLSTRVKLILAEEPATVLPGVKVSLYDRDQQDEDDLLATEVTNHRGEIHFGFDSDIYTDAEDQELWRVDSLPDLFVVVYDREDQVVMSTREEALQDKLPKLITVPVSKELVDKHGLLSEG